MIVPVSSELKSSNFKERDAFASSAEIIFKLLFTPEKGQSFKFTESILILPLAIEGLSGAFTRLASVILNLASEIF